VTGQQPGLLGGPLLTLVKAAAVAAEVGRRRASGRDAVGFLWLATADDDLPEMGWGRVAAGEEVAEVREPGWDRGMALGGCQPLGNACAEFLAALRSQLSGENAGQAIDLAARCYAAGTPLGEATATFLAHLLAGTGVVIVDALEPEVARAAAAFTSHVLEELPRCWEALRGGRRAVQSARVVPPTPDLAAEAPGFSPGREPARVGGDGQSGLRCRGPRRGMPRTPNASSRTPG